MTDVNEKVSMEQQWQRCKHHVKKVYETDRSIFMKCQQGHKKNGVEEYPVFMINKKEVSQ